MTTTKASKTPRIPKSIVLGKYKDYPLEWIPIKESFSEGKVLCVSKIIVDAMKINHDEPDYKRTNVRNWLVNEFFPNSFSEEEKEHIVADDQLGDMVFLLSKNDIELYGIKKKDLRKEHGEYNKIDLGVYKTMAEEARKVPYLFQKYADDWFLRDYEEKYELYDCVSQFGEVKEANEIAGVVPCFWYCL